MKLLQVNKFYSPDIGGVETVVKKYAELLKEDVDVTVLCVHKSFSFKTSVELLDGVTIYRCSSFGTFFSMPLSISFFFNFLKLFFKNDVFIFHLPFPLSDFLSVFFLFKRNRRFFVFWHSDIVKQRFLSVFFKPFNRLLLRLSDGIIVTSPNMLEHSKFIQDFLNKCHIIPLSIDVSSYVAPDRGGEKKFDFLFFGRFSYYKGLHVIMEALKKGKEHNFQPKVLVAGKGELSDFVKNYIVDNGLSNVTLIDDFLTENEKKVAICESRWFLFPSVATSEAFGITQVESMALGVPVINTSLPTGVPWVSINGETGYTISPDSSDELINIMINNCMSEVDYKYLSKCAVDRARSHFDDLVIKEKILELIVYKNEDSLI